MLIQYSGDWQQVFLLFNIFNFFAITCASWDIFWVRRVCVVQLKLKWNCLSWKKRKRSMGCHPTVKRVPLLTADLTEPWDMALMTTPPHSPPTTNHGTTWRPQSVTLKIWKMDSKSTKHTTPRTLSTQDACLQLKSIFTCNWCQEFRGIYSSCIYYVKGPVHTKTQWSIFSLNCLRSDSSMSVCMLFMRTLQMKKKCFH